MKGTILSAVLFFAVAAWSAPVTVVLQEGVDSYVGTEDAYILSTSGSTNYGTSADLIAKCDKYQSGWCEVTDHARVAVKFNLSGIPAGSKISKAVLSLYPYGTASGSKTLKNGSKSIYKITGTWAEATLKYSSAPAASSTALASCTNTQINAWETFDVTGDVKAIVETKAANNGYLLKFPSSSYGVKYRSSEYATAADRPKLTITYEIETGVAPQVKMPRAESYNVTVMTIQGRMICSFVAKDLRLIDRKVNSLSTGVHIVTISTPDMKHSAKMRFVK